MESQFTTRAAAGESTVSIETGVIENFVQMLQRVIPLLGNIKTAISESNAKIPKVSSKLDDVNQATELAAVEILNVIENLGKRVEIAQSILMKLKSGSEYQHDLIGQIAERLKAESKSSLASPEIKTLASLLEKYLQASNDASSISTMQKYLDETKDDFLKITMALQVQDITAQQVNTAKELIGSVQQQLTLILKHFELKKRGAESAAGVSMHEVEESSSAIQQEQDIVDKIIEEWKHKQGKR